MKFLCIALFVFVQGCTVLTYDSTIDQLVNRAGGVQCVNDQTK